MRKLAGILPALLALGLCLISPAYGEDGSLRVYLKSLGDPAALLLTLEGDFAVDGSAAIRFDDGAELALAADGNDILLSAGFVTLNMGGSLTLTRCDPDGGAYIYESERNALYQGDLRITCQDGALKTVLTIAMEDYLCGVVAYEMSDSFPLEALKAQAVAARTYAVGKKASRAASEYDVTDTASDQVFKGYVRDYLNVIAAVGETRGVVGTYHGNYAVCYYTASNGGQVATPNQVWGGSGDYDYIEQKDDPYDLENSRSLVNARAVSKTRDETDSLWQMLDERLRVQGHAEARPEEILEISMIDPAFEGSRMCRGMEFTLAISVRDDEWLPADFDGDPVLGWALGYARMEDRYWRRGRSDWKRTDETAKVTLDVYADLKEKLGLGLNSGNWEIASATPAENGWSLELRRFGHGVGMSQRGAQTMAGSYGKSWREILAFYYPGMELETVLWDERAVPALAELPRSLASERLLIPPQEGDLRLAQGEYYARVTLDSTKSRLNVRSAPGTDAEIIAKLDLGYRVAVCADAGNGWVKIRGAGFEGYVMAEYLWKE